MCGERGAELGLSMQIVNECGKITIAKALGIKNTDAPAVKQKDLRKTGKKRAGPMMDKWMTKRGGRVGIGE
jgi:hypothetical protein